MAFSNVSAVSKELEIKIDIYAWAILAWVSLQVKEKGWLIGFQEWEV